MTERKRVYDPDGQPFDVPVAKAADLVLYHGWSQTPLDPDAVPAVTTVEPERGTRTIDENSSMEDWRYSEVGREEVDEPGPRRRKSKT